MPPRHDRPVVLLAEDNQDEREMYTECLVVAGFEVLAAVNGVEANERLQWVLPDVIVMDMAMPKMDGAAAIRHIRLDLGLAHIPVVAITAFDYGVHKPLSPDVGADAFVLKPYAPDDLAALLVRLLR
jgi:CheY-like chemotaxis protein